MIRRPLGWALLCATLGGCQPAPATTTEATAAVTPTDCEPLVSPIEFPLSPGGTPEASPTFVRQHACSLRIVDVRDPGELQGRLGVIEGAQSVPQRRVATEALGWDHDAPVVVVCRSGRRSGAVARELTDMGFRRVASMTGGMLSWNAQGFPTVDGASLPPSERPPAPRPKREITRDDVAAHIADRDRVRWTKAATLMLHGTQACVDGRDAHAIVGTPGGDAGELVLALAVAEERSGRTFDEEEIERIFDAYLEAFGHFYLHSDEHAAEALVDALAAAGVSPLPTDHDIDGVTRWLNDPPGRVQGPLLDRVTDPRYVGCGHLRLMLQHPEQYGARRDLVAGVIRAFYRRLWEGHPALQLVVLEGSHEESAVVTVELQHEVHAYSRIPLVSPRLQDSEIFVAHPQVARFVRRENAAFLLEQLPSLRAGAHEEDFFADLQALADHQLQVTLEHLAPTLDHFRVRFSGEDFEVVGPQAIAAE